MSIESIFSWILCGLVVGILARFLVPGPQSMSVPMTILLGIVGAMVGGFVYSLVEGPAVEPFSMTRHNWYGWLVAVLGGMLVVWVYPYLYPRKWWN